MIAKSREKSKTERTAKAKRGRRVVLIAIVLIVVICAAYAVGSIWLNRFLNGGELRQLISRKTGVILQADAGYLPLSWRGLSVRSGGLLVKGKQPGSLAEMCATDLRAYCSLEGLVRRKLIVTELRADHLQAAFGAAAAKLIREDFAERPQLEPAIDTPSLFTVDIRETRVARTDVFWGEDEHSIGGFRNVETKYYPRGRDLDINATGGTFRQTGWPEFKVNRIDLHYVKPKLQVQSANFGIGAGDFTIAGELDFGPEPRMTLQMRSSHSPIEPYLTGKWSGKAEGVLDAEATVEKKLGKDGETRASGSVRLTRGVFHDWETLDKLALVTRRPEFRRLAISGFNADYKWDGKRLEVTKFRGESRGLICVEGKFRIEDEAINGTFEIGATANVLEAIPGAREEVFTTEHDGYFWTTMHLDGPMAHPREDLKERLVAGAEKHLAKGIFGGLFKPQTIVIDLLKTIYQ